MQRQEARGKRTLGMLRMRTELRAALESHVFGHRGGRDAPRLRDRYAHARALLRRRIVQHVLRHLRRLPAAGRAY